MRGNYGEWLDRDLLQHRFKSKHRSSSLRTVWNYRLRVSSERDGAGLLPSTVIIREAIIRLSGNEILLKSTDIFARRTARRCACQRAGASLSAMSRDHYGVIAETVESHEINISEKSERLLVPSCSEH